MPFIGESPFFDCLEFLIDIFLTSSLICCSPEPHILLFRRPLGTDPQSGRVDPELERKAREEYRSQSGMQRY